ncbi:unnamed protein product [Dibothriocephalus latus]|uniref:Uncharacterized protein n=1 Tax=Dibothriocephalus latus TaxID=60516 RepID=A0A3P7LZR0_DIBLA|nr:unnamed protein product [Dibothriocephalus latus]
MVMCSKGFLPVAHLSPCVSSQPVQLLLLDIELKRLQASGVPSRGLSSKDWAEVESTLEMLREMRDELDRSLAYRTERRNALNAGYR